MPACQCPGTSRKPQTNLIAFDLWHVARAQDWALQTLVLGVPELIDDPRWQGRGRLVTHGIGVGLSEAEADDPAHNLVLSDLLEYADATHQTILSWLGTIADEELSRQPDIPTHFQRYPVYLEPQCIEEAQWLIQQPQVWRCLSPGHAHARDHLIAIDLLKRQFRARTA